MGNSYYTLLESRDFHRQKAHKLTLIVRFIDSHCNGA